MFNFGCKSACVLEVRKGCCDVHCVLTCSYPSRHLIKSYRQVLHILHHACDHCCRGRVPTKIEFCFAHFKLQNSSKPPNLVSCFQKWLLYLCLVSESFFPFDRGIFCLACTGRSDWAEPSRAVAWYQGTKGTKTSYGSPQGHSSHQASFHRSDFR